MAKKDVSEIESWSATFTNTGRGGRKDGKFHWNTGDLALDIAQGDEKFQKKDFFLNNNRYFYIKCHIKHFCF